ncbi:MAG: DUF3024 domain-containing protein [Desulfovibrionaceae bacterium]|jgi:hypothetical protein|nr:DUF3024 domain-containing protein [Desulfovibrionaceae bacterium]
MAISEFEQHRYENLLKGFCEKQGPPPHLRDKLQWGFTVDSAKQTVELFEIRPYFAGPSRKVHNPIAKANYVKAQKAWKVYWMRGTGKWVGYELCPAVRTIEEFLKVVKEDAYCCFFG